MASTSYSRLRVGPKHDGDTVTNSTNPNEIIREYVNEKTDSGLHDLARADEYVLIERLEANKRFQLLTGDRSGHPIGMPYSPSISIALRGLL